MNFIVLLIEEKEYKIAGFLRLKNLVDENPDYKDKIFDQIVMNCNQFKNSLGEAFGQGSLVDFHQLFSEQLKSYSENINKFYSLINSDHGIKGLKVLKGLISEKEEEIFALFLLHPHHFAKYILSVEDLNMAIVFFNYSPKRAKQLVELCLDDPKYIGIFFNTTKSLNEVVAMFPDLKDKIFYLTIGNPKNFEQYYPRLQAMREIFPKHTELGDYYTPKKTVISALQKEWGEKQKQERLKFKKIFFTFECLGKRGHVFFKNAPKDIKFNLTSLVASGIINPIIHDKDGEEKIKRDFHSRQ